MEKRKLDYCLQSHCCETKLFSPTLSQKWFNPPLGAAKPLFFQRHFLTNHNLIAQKFMAPLLTPRHWRRFNEEEEESQQQKKKNLFKRLSLSFDHALKKERKQKPDTMTKWTRKLVLIVGRSSSITASELPRDDEEENGESERGHASSERKVNVRCSSAVREWYR